MDLRGRTALVTGAGKRLGRAIALALAGEKARVAVHCHRSRPEADETARFIAASGGKATVIEGDLADPSTPAALVRQATKVLGEISILVNCAAIYEETPWPVSDDDWARHLEINLTAPMRLIREATPSLRAQGGVVVNVIDAVWDRPTWSKHSAYCVSKAALAALTQNLARALAPEVRVNGVAPGATLAPEDFTKEQALEAIQSVPLGRWGRPQDVAQAVILVATNDFMTGQILTIDGGRSAV
ncbi:SDR family oxidoreductase [Candidatus Sumerlaeota bacterium]|nr:SDR family oxidoreductase [Candidatus Sumerlaeota bacterium]